jgi:hypothetical protein
MTEKEFQTNMRAAKTFQGLSVVADESDFWTGYQRGLRRHYHGEKFGTPIEHSKWMSLIHDDIRRELGLGYRMGFEGQNIQAAMKALTTREYLSEIGRRGGSVRSKRKTAAVRKNAKLGGRPLKEDAGQKGRK